MSRNHSIVFATNNVHKLQEIRSILGGKIEILSLADIGCRADIPETSDTFRGNALQKAQYVKEHFGYDCFADDSGLVVNVLGGEPGVRSARYAGPGHDSRANMDLLLKNLEGKSDRSAYFITVIAFVTDSDTHFFEGRVDGTILSDERGSGGFGYDPVFMPDGYDESFAAMNPDIKNSISHRAIATRRLMDYLDTVK